MVVLREAPRFSVAHGRPDGAGGAVGAAEHCRRQSGFGHLVADRIALLNVARGGLEELLLDFEDFLRHRHLPQWSPDGAEAQAVREVPRKFKKDQSDLTDLSDPQRWALYAPWLENSDPAVRANALICLIHQTNFLLDQQIAAVEEPFVEGGGTSEQLAARRWVERERRKADQADPPDPTDRIPACPQCGKPMVLRTAKTGRNAGQPFWGCSGYPQCKGTERP